MQQIQKISPAQFRMSDVCNSLLNSSLTIILIESYYVVNSQHCSLIALCESGQSIKKVEAQWNSIVVSERKACKSTVFSKLYLILTWKYIAIVSLPLCQISGIVDECF